MWLFIIADTMTFAACLVAYGFLRNGTPDWPRPFHSITNVALMTFILLTSSLTMLLGLQAAQAGDKAGAFRWTMITAVAGILFALLHVREWLGLIDEGMTLFKNPWGTGLFGASFFSVTGLHLTHVTAGVIALVVVGLRYKGGRYNADDIEVVGPLLALCGSGLDVRRTVGLSFESRPLDRKAWEQNAMTTAEEHKSNGIGKDLAIYVCLLALAGLQFVIAYQNIDASQMFRRMLAVACVEAGLAALFFMHLWAEKRGFLLFVAIFTFCPAGMQYGWTDSFRPSSVADTVLEWSAAGFLLSGKRVERKGLKMNLRV